MLNIEEIIEISLGIAKDPTIKVRGLNGELLEFKEEEAKIFAMGFVIGLSNKVKNKPKVNTPNTEDPNSSH